VVEAIRRLERDGLVVCHANWGAQVRTWTLADIEGIFLMREALEGIACRLFARRAGEVDRAGLAEQGRRFDAYAREGGVKECDQADVALHLHIIRCAKCPSLYPLAENSCVVVTTITNAVWAPLPPQERLGPVGVHDDLIAALCGRDPAAAEHAGKEHVRHAFERLQMRLEEQVPVGLDAAHEWVPFRRPPGAA